MDPSDHDAIARALAFFHPAVMALALTLAGLALRAGLGMRKRRLQAAPPEQGLLRSHLRVARPAVALLMAGFLAGPLSAWLLRDWRPFETLHAWLGIGAAALFGTAGWLGWKLHSGRVHGDRRRLASRHGLIGTLALLAGAVTAVAGMVLLP